MIRLLITSFVLACTYALPLVAQNVPDGFTVDTLVPAGLQRPNDMCFLPDGRVLIANSAGDVAMFAEDAGTSLTTIGTVANVESAGERGLLSIIADPAFASNGHIYVLYSSTVDAVLHLDRFTCNGDRADPSSTNLSFPAASRRVILGDMPDVNGEHNGGSLRFGPDGMLYATIGDDGNACDAQDVLSQAGCLLRLDVSTLAPGGSLNLPSYSSLDPGDNPLSANTDFSQLVLGIGLRNPFRMEIDDSTGNLYIADVGGGNREEYSEYVYQPGALTLANFGWPWREGDQAGPGCSGSQPAGMTDPIFSVPHGPFGTAIIGGARYRNQVAALDFGIAYEGSAFLLEYFFGEMYRLEESGGIWQVAAPVAGQPTSTFWGDSFSKVTSMRQGPRGALWFTQHPWSSPDSKLKRLRPTASSTVEEVSGSGQMGPAGEQLLAPLVVLVRDLQGNPLANGSVYFHASAGVALSSPNPVLADQNGLAQIMVTAPVVGGAFAVRAFAPGDTAGIEFDLFSRRLDAAVNGSVLALSIVNATSASPPQVPYVLMLSFPGSPTVPTIVGPLCIDPTYALAVVIEDGLGVFGSISFSGQGGTGSPGLTRSYVVPPGLLTGQRMRFQAVGLDPASGWFRTNCEEYQF